MLEPRANDLPWNTKPSLSPRNFTTCILHSYPNSGSGTFFFSFPFHLLFALSPLTLSSFLMWRSLDIFLFQSLSLSPAIEAHFLVKATYPRNKSYYSLMGQNCILKQHSNILPLLYTHLFWRAKAKACKYASFSFAHYRVSSKIHAY